MATLPPYLQAIGHGIHVIDTGFHRPRFDASFLIVENGRAAFVDTGTTPCRACSARWTRCALRPRPSRS
jgi:hypothetical protein